MLRTPISYNARYAFFSRQYIARADTPWHKRSRGYTFFYSVHTSVALTENGKCDGGPHRPVYGYRRVAGLAGVIHPIIVRRGHDGNRTVSVVLEQFLGRLPGLGRLFIYNIVRANREISTTCHLSLLYSREINRFDHHFLLFTLLEHFRNAE